MGAPARACVRAQPTLGRVESGDRRGAAHLVDLGLRGDAIRVVVREPLRVRDECEDLAHGHGYHLPAGRRWWVGGGSRSGEPSHGRATRAQELLPAAVRQRAAHPVRPPTSPCTRRSISWTFRRAPSGCVGLMDPSDTGTATVSPAESFARSSPWRRMSACAGGGGRATRARRVGAGGSRGCCTAWC